MSAEPSMEEILSSIKRIIAEEGDGAPARARRQARGTAASLAPPPLPDPQDIDDEVLELSDPIPAPAAPVAATPAAATNFAKAEPTAKAEPARAATPVQPEKTPDLPKPAEAPAERIVSADAAAASRGALDTLSRLMVKPEPGNDGTLEGMVREMLRPMLREWLDANLPDMVEGMVSREIKRIAGQG